MTRCDYDGVFYRVFCVTLLAIAFTFTVILTNVFIDIDGLLSTKENAKTTQKPILEHVLVQEPMNDVVFETKPENFYGDMKAFEEEDASGYRTKRSLDTPTFQFHLKNAKMKKILTNKLATLLEELDAEESSIDPNTNKLEGAKDKLKVDKLKEMSESLETKKTEVIKPKSDNHNDILHLAMHNILLQGIIGHMDLNEVYKKVHVMVENFEKNEKKISNSKADKKANLKFDENFGAEQFQALDNVESKFFEELTNCDDLHKQIYEKTEKDAVKKHQGDVKRIMFPIKPSPKTLINTIIDIKSLKNDRADHNTTETIKGVIRLIYNGKAVKFNQMDEDTTTTTAPDKENKDQTEPLPKKEPPNLSISSSEGHFSENLINQAIANYFNKFPELSKHFKDVKKKPQFNIKRLKREVKIREELEDTTEKSDHKKEEKNNEEELYVEIETHFNNKGIKGERKRKIIQSIVEKIQKAIHADIDLLQDKKAKHLHVKKRFQNPLDVKTESDLIKDVLIPLSKVVHRELYPITKVAPAQGKLPQVSDNVGESWKKAYFGPNFLSGAKSINSAELGELDLDYNNVLKSTGIPQRLQQPLNTDGVEEPFNANSYYDLGNLKFFVKEIDGSGFSIGLNQYVGEPPDTESINLFTGLENLITTYHQNYDGVETTTEPIVSIDKIPESIEKQRDMSREAYNHAIVRRSADDIDDYHSNEYKIIFKNHFLPYDSYQEIYEDKNKKVSVSIQKEGRNLTNLFQPNRVQIMEKDKVKETPFVLDEKLLEKDFNPSQIFQIASLLERKKRSMSMKMYRKLNAKSKLSRFLNTNTKTPKMSLVKNKRSKRQVDKIRIIATDTMPNIPARSDENIFVVSSDENIYNRAVQGEDIPEGAELVEKEDDSIPNMFPYTGYNKPETFNPNIFGTRSRHNALMSKYPHIFLEEISRSKEDESASPTNFRNIVNNIQLVDKPVLKKRDLVSETEPSETDQIPRDLFEAIAPKTNYKLVVKIVPKNISRNLHSGFKEVHTSINKSVNRNGLLYSSQLNVSEVSKVENMSKADPVYIPPPPTPSTMSPIIKHIKEQQEKMKVLLRQHKQKIDEQLDHIKKDKQNENVMVKNPNTNANDKTGEFINVQLPLNPPQMLHLNRDVAAQLIVSALMKLHDTPMINSLGSVATNVKKEPTTVPTTTVQCTTAKPDMDKIALINSIQHNENLTNSILNKIDKNTDILQSFLQKLTERLEKIPNKEARVVERTSTIHPKQRVEDVYPRDWREYSPFFNRIMPNLEVQKNSTHVTIPFVYAYQQPYPLPSKASNPIASVIYQGHIHTNAVRKPNFDGKEKMKAADVNGTRFFIDELENDFKSPLLNVQKPYVVAFNGTNHGRNK